MNGMTLWQDVAISVQYRDSDQMFDNSDEVMCYVVLFYNWNLVYKYVSFIYQRRKHLLFVHIVRFIYPTVEALQCCVGNCSVFLVGCVL